MPVLRRDSSDLIKRKNALTIYNNIQHQHDAFKNGLAHRIHHQDGSHSTRTFILTQLQKGYVYVNNKYISEIINKEKEHTLQARKDEAERVESLEAERVEAQRIELERLSAERVEAERVERVEAERVEAERVERVEAERVEAERVERVEAERVEAERVERVEAERLSAERVEAERLSAERVESERLEEERVESERLELERVEAECVKGDISIKEKQFKVLVLGDLSIGSISINIKSNLISEGYKRIKLDNCILGTTYDGSHLESFNRVYFYPTATHTGSLSLPQNLENYINNGGEVIRI